MMNFFQKIKLPHLLVFLEKRIRNKEKIAIKIKIPTGKG